MLTELRTNGGPNLSEDPFTCCASSRIDNGRSASLDGADSFPAEARRTGDDCVIMVRGISSAKAKCTAENATQLNSDGNRS